MKCINNQRVSRIAGILFCTMLLNGCGSKKYDIPYSIETSISAYSFETSDPEATADAFASDLCVVSSDVSGNDIDMSMATAAGLFDVNRANTVFAKNVHKTLYPASLTKTMTALIALKYGKLDDILTASSNVKITESGAQLCGFEEGDKLTLDQVLHGLLMYSGNDAAVMIAEYISGNEEEFAKLMNEEAKKLGATNTNFVNPHGLTDDNHYTTAYDLYLIFNEAMKYEKFKEIIHMSSYNSTYSDKDGNTKELDFGTTNQYLSGDQATPSAVSIIGGKTGTTNAAGSCLILLSNNTSGEPYISVILQAKDRDALYTEMSTLLENVQ